MIEIALSLAIIGFALVAIIGVLPIGMNVQRDNRQETIINQDATVFMNAIRNGDKGVDDLVNYVSLINIDVTPYPNGRPVGATAHHAYAPTNGFQIVGLLSTPKYMTMFDPKGNPNGFLSNHVVAYVRSMSGPAYEKFPQTNPDVQGLTFTYRMTSEVIPYGWGSQADANSQANLHDLRLLFRWPVRPNGQVGSGGQSFQTLVSGQLLQTNASGASLYFFEPSTYVKAQ